MAVKESPNFKYKLMFYRIVIIALVAFLLISFGIVSDTNGSKNFGLYIFALIVALPVTMLLDKYIVRFARKH